MEKIVTTVSFDGAATMAWLYLVGASALFLITLGLGALLMPEQVKAFLRGYASTNGLNTLEATLRLIAGLAFIGASSVLKFGSVYFYFGLVVVVTAIIMVFVPNTHKKYASWAVPFAISILPFYGLMSIALGGFILYSMSG